MDEGNKKLGRRINHLVMGIILGGAIGSVLGLTLAPRKGKETRDLLKQKGQQFVRDHREKFESAKYQLRKGKGFFRWLFRKKAEDEPMPSVSFPQEEEK